jgi:hypothetical protein
MSSSTDSVAQPQDEAVLGEVLVNQTALRQGQPVEVRTEGSRSSCWQLAPSAGRFGSFWRGLVP